ncbi:MAG: hypothetical protein EXR62_04395 [Chloroflexi bacterium]|nr:hypothetical protein [Chloroflexota bacterium]
MPELDNLTLAETVVRAVRAHERRTGSKVTVSLDDLPEQAPLPIKITIYRVIQEALNNSYRHGGGMDQKARVSGEADQGPGFETQSVVGWDNHLGIIGMHERVESLGGRFHIESQPGQGTKVMARMSLQATGGNL